MVRPALLLLSMLMGSSAAAEPAKDASADRPGTERPGAVAARSSDWVVFRVGGSPREEATFDKAREMWRAGVSVIDTPMPEGYPPPTPPGAIDLKRYPVVRRAEVTGIRNGDSGFWPLFRHIERHGIAMTSPVEMDYRTTTDGRGLERGDITMSFLYRHQDMNAVGRDQRDQRVMVRDAEPVTVLSLGGRGAYTTQRVERDLEVLYAWLAENPEWRIAGEPRALFYNGPTLLAGRKWLEVQIPVVSAKDGSGARLAAAASAPSEGEPAPEPSVSR